MQPSQAAPSILLVNLYFGAGAAPTGMFLESVAVGLRHQGWRVQVLAGRVGYNASSRSNPDRFRRPVHWVYCGIRRTHGLMSRLLSWSVFYVGVAFYVFGRGLPDKVLLMTTPPFLHTLLVLRNLFASKKAEIFLWNQDTYPETLAAVGLLSAQSRTMRWLRAVQRWSTRRVRRAIALDQSMALRLMDHGALDVRVAPNWHVNVSQSPDPFLKQVLKHKQAFRFLVLYTGNYGWGHDLSTLFHFLEENPGQQTFYFVFVGGGEKWSDLTRFQSQHRLPCLEVRSYVPRACLDGLVDAADFGLVALERSCVGLMSPSKIHGYLAAGKPLLYIGASGSNVAEAISRFDCGYQIDETDRAGWPRLVATVTDSNLDWPALSRNAHTAFVERYQESVGVADLIACLAAPSGPGTSS